MRIKKTLKIIIATIIVVVVVVNAIIAIQAYSLSHFKNDASEIKPNHSPSVGEMIKITFTGLDVPRPQVKQYPPQPYDSIYIPCGDDKKLHGWVLRTDSLKRGLAITFHGYMEEKSAMLNKALLLKDMGYDILMVDFMGAGRSYGDQTTLGYIEAENVKAAYDYAISEMKEDNVLFLGFSMGAVAAMKAQHDYDMPVKGVILEAPYGNFSGTVNARLDLFGLPHFPLSDIFTYWFGKLNGFDAFHANPEEFSKKIFSPTLLMCGSKDQYISEDEIRTIFENLGSRNKEVIFFPESTHESYLIKHSEEWKMTVSEFLRKIDKMDVFYD